MGGNFDIEFLGAFFCCFSLIPFTHFNLYKLRNMLTKFCEHALSRCGVMWKMGRNFDIDFLGAFFNAFL